MEENMELVAKTFQGLEDVLAEELRRLGAEDIRQGTRMVAFKGDKAMMYKANFCCRTALRILKQIHTFHASDADALYEEAKKFEWEKLLSPEKTFAIDSVVYSEEFRHSKFVTYRVKDAIADYFTEKYGRRPSIRITNPDIRLNVHIYRDEVTLSLDSSGESLHLRGYRVDQTEAPINEVLAAGLILKTGWDGNSNFIDPMCGSGTFLIEAALIARNINPGIFRSNFAFEKWPDFDQSLFESIYNDDSGERDFNYKIYGSDISPKAIAITARNIKSAGVGKYIDLKIQPLQDYEEAPQPGILVTNPPYGERLVDEDIDALYEAIGERLKKVFKGYHAWIISNKSEHFDKIGLRPSIRIPVLNGALECEFREYVIFDGSLSEFRKQGRSIRNENFEKKETSAHPYRKNEKNARDNREKNGARQWKNQGEKFRGDRDFRRDDDSRWERDRRGVRRERPKNALEEKYHKPYHERMKEERRKPFPHRNEVFDDEKVRRAVRFRRPRLFDESEMENREVKMRHREKKEDTGNNNETSTQQ